ncbi:polymer-forming cytoskeletal protein [Lachnospiraceae bacterium JLR.KK008]
MGFFSDLKEDLSQAVNELIPEEETGRQEVQRQPAVDNAGRAQAQPAGRMEAQPAPAAKTANEETEETIVEEFYETEEASGQIAKEEQGANDMTDTLESLLEKIDMEGQAAPAEAKPQTADMSYAGRSISDETAVVTAGMKIKGDVTSDGSMDVIGTIEGNIDIMGKLNITGMIMGNSKATEIYAENAKITGEVRSDGSVKIGQSSVIIGNIFANSAVIAGAVKGDIDVHGPVILDTSAIVMGNIKSKSVQINNGAVIEGMCSQCYADINPTSFFEEFKKNNNGKKAAKQQ